MSIKKYDVRIEYPNGEFEDYTRISATTDRDARVKFETEFIGKFDKFDWHGMVCFVNGAMPAEEKVHLRKIGALPPFRAPQRHERSVTRA